MPANISLKPRPTSPWPICLAPRSTRLVAWSTLVLSAAPAVPQERATAARNPGAIHVQRRVRVITHLHHTTGGSRSRLTRIWATLRQGAYHVPTRWEILGSARAVYLGKKEARESAVFMRSQQFIDRLCNTCAPERARFPGSNDPPSDVPVRCCRPHLE